MTSIPFFIYVIDKRFFIFKYSNHDLLYFQTSEVCIFD